MTSMNLSLIYGVSSDSEDHSPHPYLGMCVLVTQLCQTLLRPPGLQPQDPLSTEFSRKEYWRRTSRIPSPGLLHCRWKLYRLATTPFTYLGNSHLFYPVLWPKKTPLCLCLSQAKTAQCSQLCHFVQKASMCPYLADHEYLEVKDSAKWAIKKYLSNT